METAKKIVKAVKDSKLKVQAQIQGDELRVTGKNRDDLQAAIALHAQGRLRDRPAVREFSRLSASRIASERAFAALDGGATIAAVAVRAKLARCAVIALGAARWPAAIGSRRRRPAPPAAGRAAKPSRAADPGAPRGRRARRRARPTATTAASRRKRPIAGARGAGCSTSISATTGRRSSCRTARATTRKPNAYRETFVALANERLDADGDPAARAASTTTWRCSASRRRCRCWRRASRRTSRRRARPARRRRSRGAGAVDGRRRLPGSRSRRSATTSRRCRTPTGWRRSRRRARADAGRRRAGADARGRRWRRCARIPSCAARVDRYLRGQVAAAGGAGGAGAPALRGAAVAAEPLHAGHVRPADARGAGDLGAQERHLRLGLPGRRDAGDAAAADARAAAGRVQARARRAGRRRGRHRRGRLDQQARRKNPPTWRDADGRRRTRCPT